MNTSERDAREQRMCDELAAGQVARAAELAVEAYGPEVLRFLLSRLRDRDAADEAFSEFTLDLLRGLPNFRFECSLRVWAYRIARHAMLRCARRRQQRKRWEEPMSEAVGLLDIAQEVRTRTLTMARTGNKQYLAELCAKLPDDDQTLLILRVGRQLEWRDIALIQADQSLDAEQLARESMRLRKRFQLIKARLRRLAAGDGVRGRSSLPE